VQLLTRPVQISEYYAMRFDRRHEDASDFETKERTIVLYDENTNQWRKIGFMEAFEHSNLFDENGKMCRKLGELINIYRARGQRPRREKMSTDACMDDEMDDADQDDGEAEHPPSFFLTTPDNDGEYMLMRYFGQMEMQHATPEDMQRIGETIASNLRGGAVAQDAWRDMVRLVNDIEGQTYNHAYWVALVAANTRDNVAANGTFVGELTPEDVAEHWGLNGTKQRQWKSNAFGSLRLPQDASMRDVGFPAGYANGPGLQTLAAEARNPLSPWQDAGKRAQKAVELMQYMVDVLRMRLPDSAALDDKGRSPWFHRPDALTTFFETVVSVQRDPLFLASLPAVAGTGLNPEDSMSDKFATPARAGRGEIRWFSLPGTVTDIPTTEVAVGDAHAVADAVRNRRRAVGGVTNTPRALASDTDDMVSFFSPTTMTNVDVTVDDFNRVFRFTPEVQAFGMLPGGNTEAERRTREAYYNAVADIQDSKVRRKLIDFVYNMGLTKNRATMWRTVYGLHGLTGGELVNAVNEIHLSDGPTNDEIAAARTRMNVLSARAPETANWGGFDVLAKQWESVRPSGTATSGGISFQQSADDVQLVLDLERELMGLSNATSDRFAGSSALEASSLDGILATDLNEARVDEIVRTIRAALNRIGADITGSADNRDAAVRRAGGAPAGRVRVTESPSDILDAHYYRTPLTSSLHLVQSLSDMFGQHGVAKPLALPSDPNTAHTMPYVWDGPTSATTGGVLGRTNYDPMHISNAIGAAMEAPNYATIAELLSDSAKRRLDDTGFVMRHKIAGFKSKASIGGSSTGGSAVHFDDDDDIDSDEDDIAQVFGGNSSSATMSKRARVSAPMIGAHESSDGGSKATDVLTHRSEHRFTRTGVFAKRWAQANDIADPLVRMCTHVFLMTNCEKETTWKRMIQNDILVPMDFVLWRPLIVHDMASAILMKGGLETGANLHGGSNAAKGNDTVSKLIYYNFTFRSKAVVWKEKNVAIIENIKFEGYVGGMSTGFVSRPSDLDREDQKRPSIIVTAIPLNEKPLEKRLDFSGRLQVPETNVSIDGPITHQFSSAEYYDKMCYKLSQRVAAADPEHEDFFDRAERISLASYQGTMFGYNRNSGTYSRFTEPQGHLKRNMCYPGAASVLNGTAKAFKEYNYDLVRIE
jgi:hypothetical protein